MLQVPEICQTDARPFADKRFTLGAVRRHWALARAGRTKNKSALLMPTIFKKEGIKRGKGGGGGGGGI
jgi:hypothetical protein